MESALEDVIKRLAALDSCAVSDALDKLGLPGVALGICRQSTDRRISGRVVTAKLEPDDGRRAASRHLGTTAIEAAQPGDIIIMEQRTGIDAAAWGGNLSLAAQLRGLAGTVVEGPARDIDEAHGYGYPVFSRSRTPHTARGRIVETGTNVPVVVGDVTVLPGDYVVADGTGVVFIRAADIPAVLDAAEMVVARERAMVEALNKGTPVTQVMGINYETMLKK
jgi:4-hydroxy-4-methyl-2-oxoglutarate aldolase